MKLVKILLLLLLPGAIYAQNKPVTLTGVVKDKQSKAALPYVNAVLKRVKDSSFVTGAVTAENGRYTLQKVSRGDYFLELTYMGYISKKQPVLIGQLSEFLDLGPIELEADARSLEEVVVTGKQDATSHKMDKKTFDLTGNISQSGGSVLQAMKNLPGITVDQNGKVQLRGSDKITVLIDGKQTALTGFGNQSGLDNIPASAIEKIEIINNPSARYDANGNAGIINIIYKQNKQNGFSGKAGITAGIGALGEKQENLPTIRPQYQYTPKINPSLALNYRKNKVNLFLQSDWLYQKVLNKNEFTDRHYEVGDPVKQQYQENRTQNAITTKAGMDWYINDHNALTISGLYNREAHIDRGDLPYFSADLKDRKRLWMFYEDEVNTALTGSIAWQHKFREPGHALNVSFNYTFHREDENYYITNTMPSFTGLDSFKLIADQHVADLNIDYIKPLKHGRLEAGIKFRNRYIPTNMRFFPGLNSPMDIDAAGWANYKEIIPAAYGNYVYESRKFEMEAGLRVEYVNLDYEVNPQHNTYKSDGYNYIQPFPSLRLGYKLDEYNKLSFFYNRRVDRPDEGDVRIFPKYDDPEILKVGNPALRPQFSQTFELGYKTNWTKGYYYAAFYHRRANGTITRIATGNATKLYSIMQNADESYNTGIEMLFTQDLTSWLTVNANLNGYQNVINGFTVENKYPVPATYTAEREQQYSGNVKFNGLFKLPQKTEIQVTGIYLAPDLIPQGKIGARYSLDLGIKKGIQLDKGELFANMSDVFNTLKIRKEINGNGFHYISTDYYETQVIRVGYSYKF